MRIINQTKLNVDSLFKEETMDLTVLIADRNTDYSGEFEAPNDRFIAAKKNKEWLNCPFIVVKIGIKNQYPYYCAETKQLYSTPDELLKFIFERELAKYSKWRKEEDKLVVGKFTERWKYEKGK
mgnify:CR=1 FL=1